MKDDALPPIEMSLNAAGAIAAAWALFGPTWPERAGPAGWERADGPIRLLQYQRLPAYHAYQVAANQAAMGAIPVEAVLVAALDLLARAESTAA